jgi:glutathione S-transferase
MAPTVKLVYFGVEGRGELIRQLLHAGKVEFEDKRLPGLTAPEWLEIKDSMPFSSVPVLYWDGEEIAQTQAIARFVAKKSGLAGSSDLEFAQSDMIACHAEDLIAKWVWGRFAPSEEARVENSNNLLKVVLPKWLAQAEALLKKRGGVWFAGSGLTFGDVAVMNILNFMTHPKEAIWKDMDNVAERAALLDTFPLLKAHDLRVRATPEIAAWLQKKPEFIGL